MRKDNTAENFAVVRHIVLNILKRMDDKLSVARRRRRCCYDDDYRIKSSASEFEVDKKRVNLMGTVRKIDIGACHSERPFTVTGTFML